MNAWKLACLSLAAFSVLAACERSKPTSSETIPPPLPVNASVAPPSPATPNAIYMKFGDIKGEAKDAGHAEQVFGGMGPEPLKQPQAVPPEQQPANPNPPFENKSSKLDPKTIVVPPPPTVKVPH